MTSAEKEGTTKEQFEHGRRMIKEEVIRMGLTEVPDLHRRKVKCGFGVWPDYYGKLNPDDPQQSYRRERRGARRG